jgi:hypothetical protein
VTCVSIGQLAHAADSQPLISEALMAVWTWVSTGRADQTRPGVFDATAQRGKHQATEDEQEAVFEVFHR